MNKLKKTLPKVRTFAFAVLGIGAAVAGAWGAPCRSSETTIAPREQPEALVSSGHITVFDKLAEPSTCPTPAPKKDFGGADDDPAPDGFYLMRCKKCGQVYKICSPARPCALTAADQKEHARHRNETSKKKRSYKEWIVLDAKAHRESIDLDVKAKGKP